MMHSQPDSNCKDSYHSYPKVYNLGHKYLENLFHGPFQVEEKVDGSQFSFGHFADSADPFAPTKIKCRSKGAEIDIDNPQKMFAPAVQWVKDRVHQLHVGWTYRAEWIPKPKANVLVYNRIPVDGLVVFDISIGLEHYLDYEYRRIECHRLGLECIPLLLVVPGDGTDPLSLNEYHALLQRESFLGGPKVEGVVIKNYSQFGLDGHAMFGKYVSEEFKEQHSKVAYTHGNQATVQTVIDYFKTTARWQKSVQHLRDAGKINDEAKDIGQLFAEIKRDFESECVDECGKLLYKTFQRQVLQGITHGVAEWYKEELAKRQFVETNDPCDIAIAERSSDEVSLVSVGSSSGLLCDGGCVSPLVETNGEGATVVVPSLTDGGSH